MSEQETSRSAGSCTASKDQSGSLEETGNKETTHVPTQINSSQTKTLETTTQKEPLCNQEIINKGNPEPAEIDTRQGDISQKTETKNPSSKSSKSITENLSQDARSIEVDNKVSEANSIQNDTKVSTVDTCQKVLSQEDKSQEKSCKEDVSKENTNTGTELLKTSSAQNYTSTVLQEKSKKAGGTSEVCSEGVLQEVLLDDTRQEAKESSSKQELKDATEGTQNINQVAGDCTKGAAKETISGKPGDKTHTRQGDSTETPTRLEVLEGVSDEGAKSGSSTIVKISINSDSVMGNTVFSSQEKCDSEEGDSKANKETIGCDNLKQESGEELKNVSSSNKMSSTRETVNINDKQCKSSEDSAAGLSSSSVRKKNDDKVQENLCYTDKSRATEDCPGSSVDEGIDLHDSNDTLDNLVDEDNENIFEKVKICDELCGGDDSGVSADGKKTYTESTSKSSDDTKLKLDDMHETQELEIHKRIDGVAILPKCIDKEQLKPDLSMGSSCESSRHDNQNIARIHMHTEGTSSLDAALTRVGASSLEMISRNMTGNVGVEGCSTNTGIQGSTVGMQACNMNPDCYNPGDNLMCTDDPMRDTDSEAGDSCCSEDPDHGEACRENGCLHALDQNWEYVVDEEFNVPRKPIFNGSAEQLERRSSLKRKASEEPEESKPAKCKRGIQFEGVTVFYFPRSQGFTCVPSQGGSSLGMSRRHSHIRQFSLAEHAVEQRRAHREYLMRLRQQRSARERGESSSRGSSSEDSEENSEEASDLSDSELDADSYYFLQPLPIRQRRALLRQAGICHIEGLEKEECKDIRISREMCGCQCKVYCDPDTCQCAQAGIKCQVDRHNFPCGCSRDGCGNSFGRIEFNPIRVRTHFIHTLMRLEIEKRQTQQHHQQEQQQHHHQHQQHHQQQEWQQQQQRAKWLASSSTPANGFSGGSGLGSSNLPFFEGGRDTSGLPVTDANKFNSSVEMGACVGSMNAPLYQHFESRQMLTPGGPSVYIQHDSVGDYNSGTCSVFGGLGTTFDPSGAYGSCHGFPSASVVGPSGAQVAPSQQTPEAYNSLSKFANTTTSLVSPSFPYSGGVSPAATGSVPTVNCSYPQNNFCMTAAVHDNTNSTVFGQYHDSSAVTQNLFKAAVNDCTDFQPNFEALSSTDKTRYIPGPSLGQGKMCAEYTTDTPMTSHNQCHGMIEDNYKVTEGSSSSSCSSSPHHNTENTAELRLPQLAPTGPPTTINYEQHGNPVKDTTVTTPSTEETTEAAENLGEIVKKSMVETVSA